MRNGNKEEGLKQYEKAITCLPKTHLYDFLKGKNAKDEFLDAAIEGLKKAIELYPKDADIRSQLGSIYRKKGMYDKAIEQYEHALKLKPEHNGFRRTLDSLKNQNGSH
jgi:tetratricopeptide (TPR) repeat protein